MSYLVEQYSGIVLNQNQRPNSAADRIDITDGQWRYQEFFLPDNYVRGTDTSELLTPPLTGAQLLVGIEDSPATKVVGLDAALNEFYLNDARLMGADAVRVEVWDGATSNGWSGVSDTPELAHEVINRNGMKMLPLVNDYGRAWSDPMWEEQAIALVPLADLGVIEIANEPYGNWFWGTQSQDPIGYAQMVKRCADAVAPYGVKVLFAAGGTGSGGLDYYTGSTWSQDNSGHGWIGDAANAVPDLLERIGGLVLHPYGILPGEGGEALINAAEARLAALGYARLPLWFTECGRKYATDDERTSSPAIQAQAVDLYYNDYLFSDDHNVAAAFWYNQKDWTAFDFNGDNGWGLIDENDNRRVAWTTYQNASQGRPTFEGRQGPSTLEWKVEYNIFGIGWIEASSGTTTGAPVERSKVWMDLLFDKPFDVGADMLAARWRVGFRVPDVTSNVKYAWFSQPNPFATRFASARMDDGFHPIQSNGQDVSFLFRVLGLTADEGVDFLGNTYRSAVRTTTADSISNVNGAINSIWLSKPNPSRFAVENLYFDVRPVKDNPTYRSTNLIGDPSFETGVGAWTNNSGFETISVNTGWSSHGSKSGRCVAVVPDNTGWYPGFVHVHDCLPGGPYYAQVDYKVNQIPDDSVITIRVDWFDVSWGFLGSSYDGLGPNSRATVSNGDIGTISMGGMTAPPGTVRAKMTVYSGQYEASTVDYQIDSAFFGLEVEGVTYSDGDLPGFIWAGTPHNSSTVQVTQPDPQDAEAVVDSILVDPVTPNVYFNVYYSSEGQPGANEEDWEWKLWRRVPQTFQATKRESHVLPEPIRAKYIKIEFTHLQADHYAPGQFAQPTTYKKHPKWVLDYFLARLDAERDTERLLTGRVAVIYDALDLAYNYYLDDINQAPDQPYEKDPDYQSTSTFLDQRTDVSDQVDPVMLEKINLSLSPYREHISVFADGSSLLGQQSQAEAASNFGDQPVERVSGTVDRADLQELRNEAVVFENDYPVMFFYLTCRHRYRQAVASFENDKAYFVGVREIAFQRQRYATAFDSDQYIEPAGDMLNTERNDFLMTNGTMVIE